MTLTDQQCTTIGLAAVNRDVGLRSSATCVDIETPFLCKHYCKNGWKAIEVTKTYRILEDE